MPSPGHSIALGVALMLMGCSDVANQAYPTLAAAKADGAIERGWLPRILPASSVQIEEEHNLDTNVGQGAFSFAPADAEQFRQQLIPMKQDDQFRQGKFQQQDLKRQGYSFYVSEGFYLAVNWQNFHGRFWIDYKYDRAALSAW